MNTEQVDVELRRRLDQFCVKHEYKWWRIPLPIQRKLVRNLLPWIMEMLEEARNEGRAEPLWET